MPQWFHEILTPLMMLMVFALNITATHRRANVKSNQENAGLQSILLEELAALADLYRTNLDFMDSQDHLLVSVRSPMNIYRGNLQRLGAIDPLLARQLVSIHARNERLEMIMAGRAKTVRGGGVTAYLFEPNVPVPPDIRDLSISCLRDAEQCLSRWSLDSAGDPSAASAITHGETAGSRNAPDAASSLQAAR